MQITDVRVRKIASQNRMKAIASVTFDDVFVVHDIKVIESDKGLFIAMPSRKTPNGEFKDIAHPINTETWEAIQTAIIAKYNETDDSEETVDVCLECIPNVIKVHGSGAMGYNEYGLIENKDQFNDFNSERGTYIWKKAKDMI